MKIYVFENIHGEIARVAKNNIDEAIEWFRKTYPTRNFSFVGEL
jgi:hypothetical protein